MSSSLLCCVCCMKDEPDGGSSPSQAPKYCQAPDSRHTYVRETRRVASRLLGDKNRCLLVTYLAGRRSVSHSQALLTCHGCVAKEAGNLLLTELLLLIGQQLVEELPEHLLGRCVQNRVDIHDEGVDVPAGGGAGAGSSSLRGVGEVVVPCPSPPEFSPYLAPTLQRQSRETGKHSPETVCSDSNLSLG